MFPILPVVVSVLAALLSIEADPAGFWLPSLAIWTPLAAIVISIMPACIARLRARRILLLAASPDTDWDRLGARFQRTGRVLGILAVASYLIVLFGLRWPDWIREASLPEAIPLLDELLLFAPFLIASLGTYVEEQRLAMMASGSRTPSLSERVSFQVRGLLFPLAPLAALAAARDLVALSGFEDHFVLFGYVGWAAMAVFVVALFALAPFLMRYLLRMRSLEPGPLREDLDELAGRIGFRCRDILVWETGGRLVNAALVGLAAPLRYVILTDGLIARFPACEVRAVFAHEAAHGLKGHTVFYLVVALVFLLLFYPLGEFLPEDGSIVLPTLIAAGFLGFYWFVLFGFVSRRVEREADLFGAHAAEDVGAMIGAMGRIASLSGERSERFSSWRHFSTPRRIRTLERFVSEPGMLGRATRARRSLVVAVVALLFAGVAASASVAPRDHLRGHIQLALAEGRFDALDRSLARARERYPDDPLFVFMEGIGAAERGLDADARARFERALELVPGEALRRSIEDALAELDSEP